LHMNCISVILSLTTVVILLLSKKQASVSLSLFTSIVIFISHIFFLLGPIFGYQRLKNEPLLCSIQVTGIQYTCICIVCWVFCRSIQLYLVAVKGYDPLVIGVRLKLPMHFFCWFLPLIPVVISLMGSGKPVLTENDYWCWINPVHDGIWRWTCYYGVLFLLVFPIILSWIRSFLAALDHIKNTPVTLIFLQNLGGVFLLTYLYATEVTHEIYTLYNIQSVVLPYLHLLTYSCMGIICFISFGITQHTVKSVKQKFFENCYRKGRKEALVGVE